MHYLVYKTTNLINNKYYIGKHKTKNLNDGYFGSGKHLQYAIEKYGIENFRKEIIQDCSSEEEMNSLEKQLVTENEVQSDDCYNLKLGGEGGWDHQNLDSNIQKEKNAKGLLVLKQLWAEDAQFRAKMIKYASDKFKRLHAEGKIPYGTFLGKHHTDETKKKIGLANSIHQLGSNNSNYGNCWVYSMKEQKSILIKKEQLEEYLKMGWIKGRKIVFKYS